MEGGLCVFRCWVFIYNDWMQTPGIFNYYIFFLLHNKQTLNLIPFLIEYRSIPQHFNFPHYNLCLWVINLRVQSVTNNTNSFLVILCSSQKIESLYPLEYEWMADGLKVISWGFSYKPRANNSEFHFSSITRGVEAEDDLQVGPSVNLHNLNHLFAHQFWLSINMPITVIRRRFQWP